MTDYLTDARIVLTLDAGGTSFRFSAMQGGKPIVPGITIPTDAANLDNCLGNLVKGFEQVRAQCPAAPVAISFAFPGPADYPAGIIGDLPNLPAFRGGVALGPMLADIFRIPVFINNDGDLFVYGEAIGGLLPWVNARLAEAGSPKRYSNLFGVTLGTGFGSGLVYRGDLYVGDNSMAAEVWLVRHKLDRGTNAEEGVSIRAVRRVYAQQAGIPFDQAPPPKDIFEIGCGRAPGDAAAARESFRRLGEVAGEAIANCLMLIDSLVVIGGGLSGAASLFLPAIMDELRGKFTSPDGMPFNRLGAAAFNLEDPEELAKFVRGQSRELTVPRSGRKVSYDPLKRTGVGLSRLGTSEAIGTGAYAFALRKLDCTHGSPQPT